MNIVEKNKLIAQFLGWELYNGLNPKWNGSFETNKPFLGSRVYEQHELKFNTSWDWLMPVVEKIENYHTPNFYSFDEGNENDYSVSFSIDSSCIICTIHYKQPDPTKQRKTKQFSTNVQTLKMSKIEPTYNVVVDFIKFYNENNLV